MAQFWPRLFSRWRSCSRSCTHCGCWANVGDWHWLLMQGAVPANMPLPQPWPSAVGNGVSTSGAGTVLGSCTAAARSAAIGDGARAAAAGRAGAGPALTVPRALAAFAGADAAGLGDETGTGTGAVNPALAGSAAASTAAGADATDSGGLAASATEGTAGAALVDTRCQPTSATPISSAAAANAIRIFFHGGAAARAAGGAAGGRPAASVSSLSSAVTDSTAADALPQSLQKRAPAALDTPQARHEKLLIGYPGMVVNLRPIG